MDLKENPEKGATEHNCLKCEFVPCINLFRETDGTESGELHLYESTIKNGLHVPCEFGVLIQGLCQSLAQITDTLSFDMYYQCIRDLKAVSFLVLTGHYRNAMQIMRPVIENFLTGLYWDMCLIQYNGNEEVQKVLDDYKDFTEQEKYEIPEKDIKIAFPKGNPNKKYFDHEFLRNWLCNKGIMAKKYSEKLKNKIGELNGFLHPRFQKMDSGKPDCTACPSCVSFKKAEYEECIEMFQDITTLLLTTFHVGILGTISEKRSK